jgi:predicted nucleic acid-binding protein
MARRLILDTSILVGAERTRTPVNYALQDDEDDVVIAAVTLAELLVGVELASDDVRARRLDFVERIVEVIPVEPYDESVARCHAALLAHVNRSGVPRGAHDLIIAATAIATGRILLTTDAAARFSELPRLESVLVS